MIQSILCLLLDLFKEFASLELNDYYLQLNKLKVQHIGVCNQREINLRTILQWFYSYRDRFCVLIMILNTQMIRANNYSTTSIYSVNDNLLES